MTTFLRTARWLFVAVAFAILANAVHWNLLCTPEAVSIVFAEYVLYRAYTAVKLSA